MGNLPPIDQPVRIPISLSTPKALMDHHFQGQPVLPAVTAMEAIARCARKNFPQLRVDHLADARFEKFLPLVPGSAQIDAFAEFQQTDEGEVQAALITRTKAPKAAFTRTKVHIRVSFLPAAPKPECPPVDITSALAGVCTRVEPKAIYKDLVPFGPAFQNISAPLHISPDGALARIQTPPTEDNDRPLLGSGYALDAAFHAACVWAQHFHGVVAFPVAMDRRMLLHPTDPGEHYFGRVLPRSGSEETLIFDIFLFDQNGRLREAAQGIHMRDVSSGRLTPPDWIRHKGDADPLSALNTAGEKRTVVELDAVADFAPNALTPLERKKYEKMGNTRRKSFLAARIALKRLHRDCHLKKKNAPADAIETVHKDSPQPRLGEENCAEPIHCSVSHDRRFAIAIAGAAPAGVDVEVLSGKVLKSARLFMSAAEQHLVQNATMRDEHAAVRVWSIKEAAAKAAAMNLAEAWQRVQVKEVGVRESTLTVDGRKMPARHAEVDGHLFTVIFL